MTLYNKINETGEMRFLPNKRIFSQVLKMSGIQWNIIKKMLIENRNVIVWVMFQERKILFPVICYKGGGISFFFLSIELIHFHFIIFDFYF